MAELTCFWASIIALIFVCALSSLHLFLKEIYLLYFPDALVYLHLTKLIFFADCGSPSCLRRSSIAWQKVFRSIDSLRHHPTNIEAVTAIVWVIGFLLLLRSRLDRVEVLIVLIPLMILIETGLDVGLLRNGHACVICLYSEMPRSVHLFFK